MALCHTGSRVGATDFTLPPRFSAYKLGSGISTAEGTALGLALGAAPTAPTRVSWWKNQHLGGESTEPLSPCELSLALTRLNFPALNRSEPPQASSD